MKNRLRNLIFIFCVMCILTSCASLQYSYNPNPIKENKLQIPTKINVNVRNVKFYGQKYFASLESDIKSVMTKEMEQIFSNSVELDSVRDIEAIVNVRDYEFKNEEWWLIFPPSIFLSYVGVPMARAIGIANLEVVLTDGKNNRIKTYESNREVKRWYGLYNSKYSNFVSQNNVLYSASKSAMDDIKSQILRDKNIISSYTVKDKSKVVIQKEYVYVSNGKSNEYLFEKKSDVDNPLSSNSAIKSNRFALIIGNEDYSSHQLEMTSEINVDFARNDASAFNEYAKNILGIPSTNIVFLLDATTGQMNQGISKINLIAKNTKGNAEIFVYYAGHGLPEEQTKDAFLMPVDVSGKNAKEGIKLNDMYKKLTEYPSKNVTVFIDACFSGGARNRGLLAARGVKVKPKEDILNGNLVVFTASSGEQSSLPYKEKQHGLFTYFLLKKLQESSGNVNYKELSDYIKDNISLQSVLINDKEQTPQINVSSSLIDNWKKMNIK